MNLLTALASGIAILSGAHVPGSLGFVVASSVDSDPQAIAAADFVCSKRNDICLALAKACALCRDGQGKQVRGITIYVRSGTYEYDQTPVLDGSWILLQGEGQPFWQAFNGPWPTPSTEGGNGGTKFKLVAGGTGKDGLTVGTHGPAGAYRQQGIKIESIYFYGYGAESGAAIEDNANTDGSEISDCLIHNFKNGIDIAWDTPDIHDNNIQSCYGTGIIHRFVYAKIHGNILYDIGGSGIELDGVNGKSGDVVVGNVIGSYGASEESSAGILIQSQCNAISGNMITGCGSPGGDGIRLKGTVEEPADFNALSGNVITKSNEVGIRVNANLQGSAIHAQGSARSNAISGNVCVSKVKGDLGSAIWLQGDSIGNSLTGNSMAGSWRRGHRGGIMDETRGPNAESGNIFRPGADPPAG